MAKAKLTKEAMKFIIEKYDSEKSNYTLQDIANLVNEKFGINVSLKTVHKRYHKDRDSFYEKGLISNTKKVTLNTQPTVKDIKATVVDSTNTLERVKPKSNKPTQGFNENAGENLTKDDLKDLL